MTAKHLAMAQQKARHANLLKLAQHGFALGRKLEPSVDMLPFASLRAFEVLGILELLYW